MNLELFVFLVTFLLGGLIASVILLALDRILRPKP